jgi:acyl dehydratase
LLKREQHLGLQEGSTKLLPLIETPGAILRTDDIAQSGGGRIIGLFLGHGDLFRLSGATPHSSTTMDYPRNAVLYAARAAGIAAFDTPHTNVADVIGLEKETLEAKRHGFDGKACIHASQISVVKRCMMPSPQELLWASKVESKRQQGLLDTLAKKLNKEEQNKRHKRQTDGMAMIDGQLVGPPHIKAAQRILNFSVSKRLESVGRKGKVIQHKSDASIIPGAIIDNPYELTITEGMLDLWLQSFYTHNPAYTSNQFASSIGKCDQGAMPLPFMMSLYLCVSMSDTHGAIYHLGFRNAKQIKKIQTGETVRQKITMLSVKNTGDGKRSVVTTLRELINVDTNEAVFKTEKLEMYPVQTHEFDESEHIRDINTELPQDDALLDNALKSWQAVLQRRKNWVGYGITDVQLETDDVLLHSFARPLGVTANLALSTRFLVTHPIHLDHRRFDQGEGLGVVVSGGLVISLILAAASRDISHVIWEELLSANNVKTVSPNETIGAFSVIIDKKDLNGNDQLEVLIIKTIGVKNVYPPAEMNDIILPDSILQPIVGGGRKYDKICKTNQLQELDGNIVGEVLRKVIRVKSI